MRVHLQGPEECGAGEHLAEGGKLQALAVRGAASVDTRNWNRFASFPVGEPVEIELKLRTALEGPATISLQPRDGLQMGASQAPEIRRETLGTLSEPTAEPAVERVVVIPPAEGRFYLSVLVGVATAEGEQIRSVSIPVQVGDQPPAMQQNGELTTTGGETVRSLPAKESGGD